MSPAYPLEQPPRLVPPVVPVKLFSCRCRLATLVTPQPGHHLRAQASSRLPGPSNAFKATTERPDPSCALEAFHESDEEQGQNPPRFDRRVLFFLQSIGRACRPDPGAVGRPCPNTRLPRMYILRPGATEEVRVSLPAPRVRCWPEEGSTAETRAGALKVRIPSTGRTTSKGLES